jgi:hypothetical protein
MAPTLYPPSRPQAIGEVLDSAFRIFRASLLRCLPYGVLAIVAGQLPNIFDIAAGRPLHRFGAGDRIWWTLYVSGALLSLSFVNTILLRQRAMAEGTCAGTAVTFLDGARRAPAVVAVLVIVLVTTMLCFVPLLAVPTTFRNWAVIVLCVPATYVAVSLSCAYAALLLGGKGIFASLRYSAHLIRDNWWRTITIYSVAVAMLAVFYTLAGVIAAVLVPFAGGADVAVFTAVSAVMAAALGAVGLPFYTSMGLALFGDLEARKQGTDLERRIAGAAAG